MGRLTPGHFDDLFLNKIKSVCLHVLDQLNKDNEIEQAFDLCPSVSRRNRVILSFLRNADSHVTQNPSNSNSNPGPSSSRTSSSSSPTETPHLPTNARASRERSTGTESVASLSAQRRRQAREMQFVRDPNDSDDDAASQSTIVPDTDLARTNLVPARFPNMSHPDYTFEQLASDLDPEDKILKRVFEIVIKETARHALAKKQNRDPNDNTIDPSSTLAPPTSSRGHRPASSSRTDPSTSFARRMNRVFGLNSSTSSPSSTDAPSVSDLLYNSLQQSQRVPRHRTDAFVSTVTALDDQLGRRSRPSAVDSAMSGSENANANRDTPYRTRAMLTPYMRRQPDANEATRRTDEPTTASLFSPFLSNAPHAVNERSAMRDPNQLSSDRLATAVARNAEAERTISEVERARSNDVRPNARDTAPPANSHQGAVVLFTANSTEAPSAVERQQSDGVNLDDISLARSVSLSRRNAIRGTPLTQSDGSSVISSRSSRSTASRARARLSSGLHNSTNFPEISYGSPSSRRLDAVGFGDPVADDEHVVATGFEAGASSPWPASVTAQAPVTSQDQLQPYRPRGNRRSSSFTFITTPAAVLQSRQRSHSRGRQRRRSSSHSHSDGALAESDGDELVDLDLHLGMADVDAFDFDLGQFLRDEAGRAQQHDRGELNHGRTLDASSDEEARNTSGIQVYVSGSGASTPAEARQATFEAYAQRARLVERRRRLRQLMTEQQAGESGDAELQELYRRRRTVRRSTEVDRMLEDDNDISDGRRNSLPFPRESER